MLFDQSFNQPVQKCLLASIFCVPLCLLVNILVSQTIYGQVYLYAFLFVDLSVCQLICLSTNLFFKRCIGQPMYLLTNLSVDQSVC
jgi:hypothetical protein